MLLYCTKKFKSELLSGNPSLLTTEGRARPLQNSHSNQAPRKGSMWNTSNLIFFPQTMTIKRVFLFYQGDTPSHLPPACRNQANSSLSQVITTAQMCVPHANALISFKVCFVGSHWCHSKEPVTRGLKSSTTNCMIKLLKHACPLLILFYSTSLSEKNCCAAQCLIYISFGEEEVKGLKLRIKTLTLHCIFFSLFPNGFLVAMVTVHWSLAPNACLFTLIKYFKWDFMKNNRESISKFNSP